MITRINAASRKCGLSYSNLINNLKKSIEKSKIITLDRSKNNTGSHDGMSGFFKLSNELKSKNFDKVFIGKHWSNKLTRALNHCMNISEQHPDNFLDLEFLNMIKDPIDEMKKIYEFIGEPFGEKTEVAMEAWREENKHEMGAHKYSLEEYDLTESQINDNLSLIHI